MSGNKIENLFITLVKYCFIKSLSKKLYILGIRRNNWVFFFKPIFGEKYNSNKLFKSNSMFVSCLISSTFKTKLYIFNYFLLLWIFNFKKIFDKKKFLIFFALLIFNLPMLYFFCLEWHYNGSRSKRFKYKFSKFTIYFINLVYIFCANNVVKF